MSIQSCISAVSKSIAPNCNNPIVAGYTGRAVLIPVGEPSVVFTQLASNPRIITDISAVSESADMENVIGIENYLITPFENSAKASNADGGTFQFSKTFSFHVQQRGADISKNIIEPLAKNPLGYIAVVEKKDKVGDGSFEVIGFLQGLKVNADGYSQSEFENSGDKIITMSCVETWEEVTFCKMTGTSTQVPDYASTLAAFETLYAASMD